LQTIRRVAMLSMHTCPLANLGGRDTGGMNVYVRELSRELARRSIDVDVFTCLRYPGAPVIVQDIPHMRVIHVPAGPLGPVSRGVLYEHVPDFVSNIERFAGEEGLQYDLIHAHYWLSGLAGLLLRRDWNVPLITMFHTLARVKSEHMQALASSDDVLRGYSEQRVMTGSDRIVAANTTEREHMVKHYQVAPSKITISPLGVDPVLFAPQDQQRCKEQLGLGNKKVVFSLGRFEPLKGLDIFLKAAGRLVHDYGWSKDQLCVIVGGGPSEETDVISVEERDRLHALAADLGIADAVRFVGPLDQQRLPAYYGAADVCVVPSHYESFGLVAIEAMACGTPVVATNVGGLALTVQDGENGFLAAVRDDRSFAEQINRILVNPALQQRLGKQAAISARQYRWSAVAARILDIYGSVGYTSHSRRQPVSPPAMSLCASCSV